MRTRTRALGVCASLLAVFAVRAAADEGTKHDISRRDRWQAGDVRTVASSQKQSQKVLVKGPDGSVLQDQDQKTEVTSVAVQKVLEANAEGRITKSRVLVKEWSRTTQGQTDTSLTGALLEVTGLGRDRKWTLLAPVSPPAPGAREWLESQYGSKKTDEEATEKALLPKGPVAVGETWAADVGPLVDAVSESLPVDRAKTKIDVKLVQVQDGIAKLSIEATLPLTGMPGGPMGPAPWTEGGDFLVTLEVSRPLEGRVGGSDEKALQILGGKANQGGADIEIAIRIEGEEKTTLGGEVPEPPAK